MTHTAWAKPIDAWIQTYSGIKFRFMNPSPEEIRIEDIAHALSMLCRFNGHCRKFYSVAEHSYLVSILVPDSLALYGLLHDAGEAYLPDICRPQKDFILGFREMETVVLSAILTKYGLRPKLPDGVKQVDTRLCYTEGAKLMPDVSDWEIQEIPYAMHLFCYKPAEAEKIFLERFYQLWG